MSDRERLSRESWIEGGFRALCEGGGEALGVEPLAKRLGVTKGSFYHHFENRRALQVAMIQTWTEANTQQVIIEVEAETVAAAERIRALAYHTFPESPPADEIESAMRSWAALDPEVEAAVAEVDERRIIYVTDLLRSHGLTGGLAERRAKLFYRAMIGEFTWRAAGGPTSTSTEIDELVDLVLAGPSVELDAPMAALSFRRTPDQVADPALAWQRPDRAFFAAGACHILAQQMAERTPGLTVVHLRPHDNRPGSHVYATDGQLAFDFNGWTDEADLIAANVNACRVADPSWCYDRVIVDADFDSYWRAHNHRTPEQYPGDVVTRAQRFIDTLLDGCGNEAPLP